ncbi:MAG: family 1 glycosylhydrolase [Calditrichaeota bacterium]|nr:family 1 glycosylhydrolase [Calditrichota bacterium]
MSEYPNNFLWGAATSAFQSEGHIKNDMLEWEKKGHFRKNGKDPVYGNASDHWHHWREDFDLLAEYGLNAYRFSVEWARIVPEPGKIDEKALDQYKQMVDYLLKKNITPMLTFHHFTHPSWFHEISPWHTNEALVQFTFFVDAVMQKLGKYVDFYITLNEPLVWALAAYGDGVFPPGKKDLNLMMQVVYNLLLAHKSAYSIVKKYNPKARVGIAKNIIFFQAKNRMNPVSVLLKSFVEHFFNDMLFKAFGRNKLEINLPFFLTFNQKIDLKDSIDFWGINYYYRMFIRCKLDKHLPFEMFFENKSGFGLSDMGWEIYPPGLTYALKKAAASGKEIYITENGIATDNDNKREKYLELHLEQIQKVINNGLNLKGYFYWSLLDNYEWIEGTNARFGLIEVDYAQKFARKAKPSLQFFSNYIKKFKK